MAMCTHSQPAVWRETPSASLRVGRLLRAAGPVNRQPAPPWIRPEAFDVDVDQLTWPPAFVANGWLEAESAELAHPDPGQDPRHGRERHVEHLGDLRAGEPHPPQSSDRRDPLLTGSVRDPVRRRGPIPRPGAPAQQRLGRAPCGLSD